MSRAKTSHRIRRAKNARTGHQILRRKIYAAFGLAAVKVTIQRIELHFQKICDKATLGLFNVPGLP